MQFEYEYQRPALTTDIVCMLVVRRDQHRVLLIKRGSAPFKDCWALPGGFVNPDETSVVAAKRELHEETGLNVASLQLLEVRDKPNRDPRGWTVSIAYLALFFDALPSDLKAGDDAVEARWFSLEELPPLMAFDHAEIISAAKRRLA